METLTIINSKIINDRKLITAALNRILQCYDGQSSLSRTIIGKKTKKVDIPKNKWEKIVKSCKRIGITIQNNEQMKEEINEMINGAIKVYTR